MHIASRTASKVQEAIKANPGLALEFVEVNLSDLKSVKRAGATLAKLPRLDGIVLNAGVMATPYRLTADGVEEQFQINHLAHFALVQSLMPLLEKTGAGVRGKPARIVALSSFAHNFVSRFLILPDADDHHSSRSTLLRRPRLTRSRRVSLLARPDGSSDVSQLTGLTTR